MIILEARHLQKSYTEKGDGVIAVRDVSLQIMAGEVLAFLGPNGAGKTTTIKMIAGLIQPDAGWVRMLIAIPTRTRRHYDCWEPFWKAIETYTGG